MNLRPYGAALALLAGVVSLIAIAPPDTTESQREVGGQLCIVDDIPIYQDPYPPEFYSILYPADDPEIQRDKNGEVIQDDPTGSPATQWMVQDLMNQPPVLYWPAPAYKQILTKRGKPCADKANPVVEPGILALIGAALLAAAVMK